MHKKNNFVAVAVAACSVMLVSGCGKSESESSEIVDIQNGVQIESQENPIYDFLAEVGDVLGEKYDDETGELVFADKEGATAKLAESFDNPKFKGHETELFTVFIRFLIYTGQMDEAKTRFLNAIRTNPEWAKPGFDLIYGHYAAAGDSAAMLDWAGQLLLQPLPDEETKYTANEWYLSALIDNGKTNEFVVKIPEFVNEFDGVRVAQLVNRLGGSCMASGKLAELDIILAAVNSTSKKDDPDVKSSIASLRLLSLAGKGEWDVIAKTFLNDAKKMTDRYVQTTFAKLCSQARSGGQYATLDTLSVSVLKDPYFDGKEQIRNIAAREWVASAASQDNMEDVVARIAELNSMTIQPRVVSSLISRHFYAVVEGAANTNNIREILVQADIVSPKLEDDGERTALNALMLDASFLLEDYDRVLRLLQAGIADRDEAWHKMAITKVKAHKALKEGRTDDAVAAFRDFMETIKAGADQDQVDPVSEVVHTKDMILGFNAKRIGKIYADAGVAEKSSAAYAEAREYYERALENPKNNAETIAEIRKELDEIEK